MQTINVKTPVPTRGRAGAASTGTAAVGKGPAGELTMYKELPSGEVSVEEFEKYALDRLRGEHAPCSCSWGMGSRGGRHKGAHHQKEAAV